jgi:hypothetical protein
MAVADVRVMCQTFLINDFDELDVPLVGFVWSCDEIGFKDWNFEAPDFSGSGAAGCCAESLRH